MVIALLALISFLLGVVLWRVWQIGGPTEHRPNPQVAESQPSTPPTHQEPMPANFVASPAYALPVGSMAILRYPSMEVIGYRHVDHPDVAEAIRTLGLAVRCIDGTVDPGNQKEQ